MQIYLHGNNLSTLHEHLPTDILPAELGGTGPAFNPGLWAEPVIHLAMKEAELAAATATKKGKEQLADQSMSVQKQTNESKTANGNHLTSDGSTVLTNVDKTPLNNPAKLSSEKTQNVINKRSDEQKETTKLMAKNDENNTEKLERDNNGNERHNFDDKTDQLRDDLAFLDAEINLNEFEMIPSRSSSDSNKNNSLDNRLEGKALIITSNNEAPSEKTNLIT